MISRIVIAILFLATVLTPQLNATEKHKLKVGITLHPYYCYVSHIVGDRAEVVPLIDGGANPHSYSPTPADIKRATTLDVLVVNGIGHDQFALDILKASGESKRIKVIYANDDVSLIPVGGTTGDERIVNSHTFVSINASIRQIYTIAEKLGEIDPSNSDYYRKNARDYAKKLRKLKMGYLKKVRKLKTESFNCATLHGGYDYLLREFGMNVAAVIEPAHGLKPTAAQLKEVIDRMKELNVPILFAEKDYPDQYVETLKKETGARLYALSHISSGTYDPDMFEREMDFNMNQILLALQGKTGDRLK